MFFDFDINTYIPIEKVNLDPQRAKQLGSRIRVDSDHMKIVLNSACSKYENATK